MKFNKKAFQEIVEQTIPFNRFLGIRMMDAELGRVRLALPFREEFIGDWTRPAMHGGVISTLLDTAGGAAAWTYLEPGDRLSTVDLLVDYLLPVNSHSLEAEAKVIRIGNRVAVVSISVFRKGEVEPVAQGRAVYNIVRQKKSEEPNKNDKT